MARLNIDLHDPNLKITDLDGDGHADVLITEKGLSDWAYQHKKVNRSAGEYARDEHGDGFHEVHVNTLEGVAVATLLVFVTFLAATSSWYLPGKITLVFGLL